MTDSRLTVDLDALAANYDLLKRLSGVEVAPVVKANGYGLGAGRVARRLHARDARTFFVARVMEGWSLRETALGDLPASILVLDGATTPDSMSFLVNHELTPVLNSIGQVAAWAEYASGRGVLQAALHVDTGMNRLGLKLEEAELISRKPPHGIRIVHVMSHLACADEPDHALNARQLAAFQQVRALFPNATASLANSAGVFLGRDYAFDLTRPGIALYGGGPCGRPDARLQTVATLEAPILQIRDVRAGDTVGYGATFTAPRPMQVAILGTGYADGLLRAASPGAFAALNGRRAPLIGRVSMDLIAVDVSDIPAREGDMVQLLGPEVPIDELATAAGTLAYELLVRLAPRAELRYIGAV